MCMVELTSQSKQSVEVTLHKFVKDDITTELKKYMVASVTPVISDSRNNILSCRIRC